MKPAVERGFLYLLLIAIAIAGVAVLLAESGRRRAEQSEAKTKETLRDAYVTAAEKEHDPNLALRALAIDHELGHSPSGRLRRALVEADLAARAVEGVRTYELKYVPDTIEIGPEKTPIHLFVGTGTDKRETYDTTDTDIRSGPVGFEEAWPDDPNMRVAIFDDVISLTDHKGFSRKTIPFAGHIVGRAQHHLLLVRRYETKLYVLDARSGDLREVGDYTGPAVISPDGSRVVARDGKTKDRAVIVDLNGGKPTSLEYAPVAQVAAKDAVFFLRNGYAHIWPGETALTPATSMYRSHAGALVLLADAEGGMRLVAGDSGHELVKLVVGAEVTACAFSHDDQHFAVGTKKGDVFVYSAVDGVFENQLLRHEGPVRALSFSYDARFLASAGEDRLLRLSPLAPDPLARMIGQPEVPFQLPGDRSVVRLSIAGAALVGLDAPDVELPRPNADLGHVDVATDRAGTTVIVYEGPFAKSGGTIDAFDAKSRAPLFTLPTATGGDVALSPDGRRVVTRSSDTTVLRDTRTGKPIGPVPFGQLVFSKTAKRLAVARPDGTTLWDGETGRQLGTWSGNGRVAGFTPNEDRLVVFSTNGVYVLDGNTLAEVAQLPKVDVPDDLQMAGDGSKVVANSGTGAQVFDAATGRQLWRFPSGATNRCAWSEDGKRILVIAGSRPLVLDGATGEEVRALPFLPSFDDPKALALDREGRRAAIASSGRFVRIWDVASGELLAAIPTVDDWAERLALPRDGRFVVFTESSLARARAIDISFEDRLASRCKLVTDEHDRVVLSGTCASASDVGRAR